MQVPADIAALFQEAEVYHQRGDVYNAVKLCKRIIKRLPDWYPPYALLGLVYKYRHDWKAALHYNKKAVSLDASDRMAWWNVGIAATALKKIRLARSVWQKFGFSDADQRMLPALKSARVPWGDQFDMIWVRPIDPVRGVIDNIPAPGTDRRFCDIVLLDGVVAGYNVAQQRRIPVYEELGLYKRSLYHTYSCWIAPAAPDDVERLAELCSAADLGFENWSNAAWVLAPQMKRNLPEYYGPSAFLLPAAPAETHHIAIAAPTLQEAEMVLRNWQIISLGHFGNLTCHL